MKRAATAILFLLSSFAAANTISNNDDLLNLVRAGMSDAVILQAIDGSSPKFDTSAKALITLKKAGASDAVIQRVLGKTSQTSSATASSQAIGGKRVGGKCNEDGGGDGKMGIEDEGRIVTIAPARSDLENETPGRTLGQAFANIFSLGFAPVTMKGVLILEGNSAQTRLQGNEPRILEIAIETDKTPEEKFALARLTLREKTRSVRVGEASQSIRGTKGKIGVPAEASIPLDVTLVRERCTFVAQGGASYVLNVYTAKPKTPLTPGEYGVVMLGSGRVFDFGVDKDISTDASPTVQR